MQETIVIEKPLSESFSGRRKPLRSKRKINSDADN